MATTPEALREHWRTVKAEGTVPAVFDPEQTNWGDLQIRELAPAIEAVLNPLGYKSVLKNRLPIVQPFPNEYPDPLNAADLMDSLSKDGSSQLRVARQLLDPEDQIFMVKGDPQSPEVLLAMRAAAHPAAPHNATIWRMNLDIMVNLPPDLSELDRSGAAGLIHPNSARSYTASNGTIHMRNRAAARSYSDAERMGQDIGGGSLFYFLQLGINRDGRYPISAAEKPEIIAGVADVIRQEIAYGDKYRNGILEVLRFARTTGVDITRIFAAREA